MFSHIFLGDSDFDRALALCRTWAVALAHGGKDEGKPGLRPDYDPFCCGSCFRDNGGNKLAAACHQAR